MKWISSLTDLSIIHKMYILLIFISSLLLFQVNISPLKFISYSAVGVLHYTDHSERYLSYQSPGNGWNNQRIALEHAIVFAKLLNRTLLAPPISPHSLSIKSKRNKKIKFGYQLYNLLSIDELLLMSQIIDFPTLSQLISVIAIPKTLQFLSQYQNYTWKRVCHSRGYGMWIDRKPKSFDEKIILKKQHFIRNNEWMTRCQFDEHSLSPNDKLPIIRYFLNEFSEVQDDILYFDEGTLFAIDFRFFSKSSALLAQRWLREYVIYHPTIRAVATKVDNVIRQHYGGKYNAVHVRRNDRLLKYDSQFWLKRVSNDYNATSSLVLYISTDEENLNFFKFFIEKGYSVLFRSNLSEFFRIHVNNPLFQNDIHGMVEQLICSYADNFVPAIHSTFTTYIKRLRKEVPYKDNLATKGYYFVWAMHFISNSTMNMNS